MPVERTTELISKITIPSILVSKDDAENFKRVFESGNENERSISLAINFSLVKKSGQATIKMIL